MDETPPPKVTLSNGLEGFDESLQLLIPYFEQLQLVSVEAANPALDLLTFAYSAHYFGVITLEVAASSGPPVRRQAPTIEVPIWDGPRVHLGPKDDPVEPLNVRKATSADQLRYEKVSGDPWFH